MGHCQGRKEQLRGGKAGEQRCCRVVKDTRVTGHGEVLAALLCSPARWHGRSLPSKSALLSFLVQREPRQLDTRALIPNQVEIKKVNSTSDGFPRL